MEGDEDVLVVKSPVYLFNIPPRLQRRKGYIHRAADWDVKNPNWIGKISLIAAGPKCCHLQLEDFDGDIYAQAVIESYPTPIIQAVMDSKRFFMVEIQTISGNHEIVGIGYNTRNDSGDFIDTLEEYFTKTDTEKRVKRVAPPVEVVSSSPSKKAKTEEDKKVETELKVDKENPGKTSKETEALSTNGHNKPDDSSSKGNVQKADVKADAEASNDVKTQSVDSEVASDVKPSEPEPVVQAASATIDNPVVESKTEEVPPDVNMDTDSTAKVDAPEIVKSTEQVHEKMETAESENPDESESQQPLVSNPETQSEKDEVADITAATEVAQEAVSEVVAAAESAADDALDIDSSASTVESPAENVAVNAMEVETAASEDATDKGLESDVAMDQESPITQQLADAPVQENLTAENNESELEPESSPSLGATLQTQDSLDLLTAGIDENEALDLDVLESAVLPLEDTTESTQELEAMGNKVLMDATEAAAESSNLDGSATADSVNPITTDQLEDTAPATEKQSETSDNGTVTIEPETTDGTNDKAEEQNNVEDSGVEAIETEDEVKQEKEVEDEEKMSLNNSMSIDESEDPLAGAEPASEATLPPGYKYQTEPGGAFNCHKCPETFATYNLMKRHWSTIHNLKQASHCPVCLLPFPNKAEVNSHKLEVHGFKCEDCGKQFKKDQGLRDHMLQNHGKTNLFQCPHCDSAFKMKFQLVKHIEAEHEDELGEACVHQCGVCNQKFVTEEELNVHKQRHEGSSGCPHCSEWTFSGPRMASKKKLAEHIRKEHPDKVEPVGPRRVSTRGHRE